MNLVVTGTSTGIGRALAAHLLKQGHAVWGLARSPHGKTDDLTPAFRASRCDVADWKQVEKSAHEIAAQWGHVDGLVTCAGTQGEIGRTLSTDPQRWSDSVRVNLDGTYYSIRAFHALLSRAPRRAKVICFSGGGATKARPNFSAYAVAKTGVVRLVETIAEEERASALDINALAPGAINTRLTEQVAALGPHVVGETEYQAALKQIANGGASLEKVFGLVDWLLSPASDGVSGRLLAAQWDAWTALQQHAQAVAQTDVYTLRRILPNERGLKF